MCFVSVLCVLFEFVDDDGRRDNAAQALAQWRHPVALSEAMDVLHRAMHPASYRCIDMAIEIVVDLPAFVVAVDSVSPTNLLSILLLATTMLKTMLWSI